MTWRAPTLAQNNPLCAHVHPHLELPPLHKLASPPPVSIGETVARSARRFIPPRTTERAECFRIWINKRRCFVSVFIIIISLRHSGNCALLDIVCETKVSVSEVWFSGVTTHYPRKCQIFVISVYAIADRKLFWMIYIIFLCESAPLVRPNKYSRLIFARQIRLMTFAGILLCYYFQHSLLLLVMSVYEDFILQCSVAVVEW